jgi:hypothetical protein
MTIVDADYPDIPHDYGTSGRPMYATQRDAAAAARRILS